MFTDTHCHLSKEYYRDIEEILACAKRSQISRFIVSGVDYNSNLEAMELISNYPDIYATIGIHPHEASRYDDKKIDFIKKNIDNERVIALGEIGLDYYYGKEYKEKQKELLEIQLKIAEEKNIPVVIHSRDATEDMINILKKYNIKGVIHSFSGSYESALEYVRMGFILGISGVITFKNSKLKEVISKIDLEYIVLETDCPYLTPEPFRGRQNEPKYILEIAKFISDLKGISLEDLATITNQNISRIFDI